MPSFLAFSWAIFSVWMETGLNFTSA
jgi:hypothetical protein